MNRKKRARRTRRSIELADLKRLFALAMQAGQLLHRPYTPMLKEDNVRKGFFERDQFDAIRRHLDAIRRHLKAPLDHAVTLGYCTGWSMASEILTLQWHQIDRTPGGDSVGAQGPRRIARAAPSSTATS